MPKQWLSFSLPHWLPFTLSKTGVRDASLLGAVLGDFLYGLNVCSQTVMDSGDTYPLPPRDQGERRPDAQMVTDVGEILAEHGFAPVQLPWIGHGWRMRSPASSTCRARRCAMLPDLPTSLPEPGLLAVCCLAPVALVVLVVQGWRLVRYLRADDDMRASLSLQRRIRRTWKRQAPMHHLSVKDRAPTTAAQLTTRDGRKPQARELIPKITTRVDAAGVTIRMRTLAGIGVAELQKAAPTWPRPGCVLACRSCLTSRAGCPCGPCTTTR